MNTKRGSTLIELLVVLAISTVLPAIPSPVPGHPWGRRWPQPSPAAEKPAIVLTWTVIPGTMVRMVCPVVGRAHKERG